MKNLKYFLIFLITCTAQASFSMVAPAGDDCTSAIDLAGQTSPISSTTVGATNDFSFCTMGSATDLIYYYDLPVGSTLTIQQTTNAYDSRHSLRYSGACPGTIEIVCTDDPDTQVETWQNCTGATERVYWIQSGYSAGEGTFTLDWSVTAGTCPTTATNDECGTAIALTVNPDLLCGTVTSGTVIGATASSQSTTACGGTEDDDVWFSFVATSSVHEVSLLNISGSTTDMYHSVWEGTCPGAMTLVAGTCSDPNSQMVSGLTPGNTYYVRVYTWTSTTGQTSSFDICIGTPPPPPANDECAGAVSLTVNPDLLCGTVTAGTVASATGSIQSTTACGGTEDDDVWFSFVATSTTHEVSLLNAAGSTTDLYHSIWEGTCPSLTLVSGTCSDPNNQTVGGLVPGNTYYVRVYSWTSSTGQTTTFDICIGTPPPPGPCTADMTINTTMYSQSGLTTCGFGDDFSSTDACGSSYMNGDDIIIEYTPTTTECVSISLSNTGTYTGVFVLDGCADDPNVNCLASNTSSSGNPSIQLFNVAAGTSYYIHISTFPSPQCTPFDLDISACPPFSACGNLATNDFCSNPGTLTQGSGTWNNTTTGSYTADTPGNITTPFCGSIENNSWYQFTAQSTTETFVFSNVGGTNCGSGIQVQIYDVTTDANGCCTNFTSVSNCFNPGTQVGGTVTATPLVVGNTYYMMIDGNAGAGCDFSVANWDVSLPVKLIDFQGYNHKGGNKLVWSTATEINNDYFIVQRSSDGYSFENLGIIDAHGNSNRVHEYSFIDEDPNSKVSFYRLKQIDFNGIHAYSKIIFVENSDDLDIRTYPNPTSENFYFDISVSYNEIYTITYTNIMGSVHKEYITTSEGKNTYQVKDFVDLAPGIYFTQILNGNNEVIKSEKIIKK